MGWSSGTAAAGGGGGGVSSVNGDSGPAVVVTLDGISAAEATGDNVDVNGHKVIGLAAGTATGQAARYDELAVETTARSAGDSAAKSFATAMAAAL